MIESKVKQANAKSNSALCLILGAIRQMKSSEYITTIYCFLIGLHV